MRWDNMNVKDARRLFKICECLEKISDVIDRSNATTQEIAAMVIAQKISEILTEEGCSE